MRGRTINYREAGEVSAPAILLLLGLPGGSAEYGAVIRVLAGNFDLIAPDYTGFGASEAPEPGVFTDTFKNLTDYVAGLIEAIGIERTCSSDRRFSLNGPIEVQRARCLVRRPRGGAFPWALSLSTEWEAASQTRPVPGRGETDNIFIKEGGRRRKVQEIA